MVEPVFGFASDDEANAFLDRTPEFGGHAGARRHRIVKFFLNVGREMQMKRLHARHHDPLKRWKLSELDYKAIDKLERLLDAYREDAGAHRQRGRALDHRSRQRQRRTRSRRSVTCWTSCPIRQGREAHGRLDRKIVLSAAIFSGRRRRRNSSLCDLFRRLKRESRHILTEDGGSTRPTGDRDVRHIIHALPIVLPCRRSRAGERRGGEGTTSATASRSTAKRKHPDRRRVGALQQRGGAVPGFVNDRTIVIFGSLAGMFTVSGAQEKRIDDRTQALAIDTIRLEDRRP